MHNFYHKAIMYFIKTFKYTLTKLVNKIEIPVIPKKFHIILIIKENIISQNK